MDVGTAAAILRERQLDACKAVCQCFGPKTNLTQQMCLAQVAKEFGIDSSTLAAIKAELNDGLSMPAPAPERRLLPNLSSFPAPELPPKPAPKTKKLAKVKAMELNPPPPQEPVVELTIPADPNKRKALGNMNFRLCRRYWAGEYNSWFDGVIINYKPQTGFCTIVYKFAQKTAEREDDYNLHAATKEECQLLDQWASKKDQDKWRKMNAGG